MKRSHSISLLNEKNFQRNLDGKTVRLFTLQNQQGAIAQLTNYGATLVALWMPDTHSKFEDVVLGFDDLEGYLGVDHSYLGATVGRYANRIAGGTFELEGERYTLVKNNGPNHLHGGTKGFNAVVWQAQQHNNKTLELHYLSEDMEEGFPGNLDVKLVYTLTDSNVLNIEYWATTDKTTIVNLCNHAYFNLKGAGNGSILDHQLQLNAHQFTPADTGQIPTGEIRDLKNTPLDFGIAKAIGLHIDNDYEQLQHPGGYDHNYILNKENGNFSRAAVVIEPESGRVMDVFTTAPGMQFYTANNLKKGLMGKNKKRYGPRSAFCLETQHYPDSPNQPHFPSTVLTPGEQYYSLSSYQFRIMEAL